MTRYTRILLLFNIQMRPLFRNFIIVGTFALMALFGLFVSLSAPYISSGDELVYLTGTLQAKEGTLPDAYMLQGYDYSVYLYPKIMSYWYEPLGYYAFKSIYLFALVLATGLSAYTLFRFLRLPWLPSLLLSVVLLIPRFSSGTEIFGILTFREAIGRQIALPLFLVGTAFLIRRMIEKKSLWPVFGIFGFGLFLHPVTVMLFSFISLVAITMTRLFQRVSALKVFREVIVSGAVFVLSGSYFFIDVFARLARGVADEGVSTDLYAQAIMFRNAWEFLPESLLFFRHMAIVSVFFVALIVIFYSIPALRLVRAKYLFPTAGRFWFGDQQSPFLRLF